MRAASVAAPDAVAVAAAPCSSAGESQIVRQAGHTSVNMSAFDDANELIKNGVNLGSHAAHD